MGKVHFPRTGGQQWVDSFYRPHINTTGDVRYVDSVTGSTTGPGFSPETAYSTLKLASAACAADNGDILYLMEGHAETIAAGADVDLTVAGVRIIGLGHGASRPTFTFTAAASTFAVGANSQWIENLLFVANFTNGVTEGVDIDSTHTDIVFKNCEWRATASTKEFLKAVTIAVGAIRCRFDGCHFREITGGDATTVIFTEGEAKGLKIENCTGYGDWSVASFDLDATALTDGPEIYNNIMFNADTGAGLFCSLNSSTVAMFLGNRTGIGKANTVPVNDASASVFIDNLGTDAADLSELKFPATATAWA